MRNTIKSIFTQPISKWRMAKQQKPKQKISLKYALTLLAVLAAIFFNGQAHAQYVHTNGTKIVDGNNNQIVFTGMNLGNWLVWEGYLMMGDYNFRTHTQYFNSLKNVLGGFDQAMAFERQWRLNYVTEQTIIDLKNLGFNSVRVPFNYNMFWYNNAVSDGGFEYFDRLISYCRKNNVYILLDMHAAPGYQNPGDHSDNINSNSSQPRNSVKFWDGNNVDIAAQVWRHIANRYKNETIIWGYDLINEPVPQDGREYELMPSLIKMRNAIREVDNNHIIVAEASWWASDMSKLDWGNSTTQSRTGVYNKWDNNLVYETHHYVGGNAAAIQDLYGRVEVTNRLGIPLILGEFGEDTPQILRTMADWATKNTAGYFPWSFKKMFHDKTLWTVQPNDIYNQVRNSINAGEYFVNGAAQGMVSFAQNNIINGAPGLQWHQDFYDSVRPINVPTVVGPAGYTKCAGENQTCSFTGRASVAYGANNVFNYADASNSVLCSNSAFGDPVPGVAKACFYRPIATGPAGYTLCAAENQTCSFSGNASVAYGANNVFNYLDAINNIACANNVFGDPLPGVAKSCFYRSTTTPAFTKQIEAETYSSMNGVQLETTTDAGGGQDVGWIDANDWMAYANITLPSSGNYKVEYRVASPTGATLSLDLNAGSIQLGQLAIPATNGWQSWTTISHTVSINAGTYSIGVFAPQGGWNINWIKITKL